MNKLFLIDNNLMGFFPKNKSDYNIYSVYDKTKLKEYFRRGLNKFNLPWHVWLFNHEWTDKLEKVDAVIIFDSMDINRITDVIKRRNPQIKVFVWYWNPVSKAALRPDQLDKRIDSVWTYDRFDATNFKLKLNTQFYFREELERKSSKNSNLTDVFFVGADKGREKKLNDLKQVFIKNKIEYYFHLTKFWASNKVSTNYKKNMAYNEVIECIRNTKSILDLVNGPRQEGISLRPLEALFFKKKLITNNKYIENEKLYNKQNVFILGKDDDKKIKEFVNGEFYRPRNYTHLLDYYSFNEWAKRFDVGI